MTRKALEEAREESEGSKIYKNFCNKDQIIGTLGFPGSASGEEPASSGGVREEGLSLGSGRFPGEGNGNPLQYHCLENLMDRKAWWATAHGATESQTQLNQLSTAGSSEDY